MNMTQATHAGVGTTCNNCHEAGLSFYMGAASPGCKAGRRITPQANRSRRTTAVSATRTANWNTTACRAGTCRTRRTRPAMSVTRRRRRNYTTLAANSVLHTGITTGCAQCHGGTTAADVLQQYHNPKAAVLAPAHIPYLPGTDCGSCHTSAHLRRRQLRADEHDPGHARRSSRPPATPVMRQG